MYIYKVVYINSVSQLNSQIGFKVTPAEAMLILYLLFHPSYPARVASYFKKVEKLPVGCVSLKQQPHINKMMLKLKSQEILEDIESKKLSFPGRKRRGYQKINSKRIFRLKDSLLINIKTKTVIPGIDRPSFYLLRKIIEECSADEVNTIQLLSKRFKKFDYGTLLIQIISVIREINNTQVSNLKPSFLDPVKVKIEIKKVKSISPEQAILSLNQLGKTYENLFYEFAKSERLNIEKDVYELIKNMSIGDDKNVSRK